MMRHGQLTEDNQQLLTLVHGVDHKGRAVVRAYTGNSKHPAYHEYQDVIDKQYSKAARLASSRSSRTINSLYRLKVNDRCFDCYSRSTTTSAATTHVSTRWTGPSLPGSSRGVRTPIIPDLRGMRAVISRLRCSLAIHTGLAGTSNELTFLPVIPVRFRKQPSGPKKECTNEKPPPTKPDLKGKSRKDCCSSVPQSIAASLSYNTDCCQGSKGQTCSKAKKTNGRAKKTNKRVKKHGKLR